MNAVMKVIGSIMEHTTVFRKRREARAVAAVPQTAAPIMFFAVKQILQATEFTVPMYHVLPFSCISFLLLFFLQVCVRLRAFASQYMYVCAQKERDLLRFSSCVCVCVYAHLCRPPYNECILRCVIFEFPSICFAWPFAAISHWWKSYCRTRALISVAILWYAYITYRVFSFSNN